jgi:6-phosphogluconate dehydrogenase
VVYDTNAKSVEQLAGEGATGSRDMAHMVSQMAKPRAIWVMLPAGAITEATVSQLGELLEAAERDSGLGPRVEADHRTAAAVGLFGQEFVGRHVGRPVGGVVPPDGQDAAGHDFTSAS